MKNIFLLLAATVSCTVAVIRVDNKKHFEYCDTPQNLELVSVEVDGPGCKGWPCFLYAGATGAFRIKLHNHSEKRIHTLITDIHGTLKLKGIGRLTGRRRMGMPGEVKKNACPFTTPGCPIEPGSTFAITKIVRVPNGARNLAHGIMTVEFKVKDGAGNILTCFKAPVRI